jgi:hypothetical protein
MLLVENWLMFWKLNENATTAHAVLATLTSCWWFSLKLHMFASSGLTLMWWNEPSPADSSWMKAWVPSARHSCCHGGERSDELDACGARKDRAVPVLLGQRHKQRRAPAVPRYRNQNLPHMAIREWVGRTIWQIWLPAEDTQDGVDAIDMQREDTWLITKCSTMRIDKAFLPSRQRAVCMPLYVKREGSP